MAIYLKKFETQAAYEAAESGLILPNVSLTVDNNTVHYNPSAPPTPTETRLVAKFDVTSTSDQTRILSEYYEGGFDSIEIDGVEQQSVVTEYTFNALGEHTVKYTLTDPTSIGDWVFSNCSGITSVNIPSGVISIGSGAFEHCSGLTSIDIPNSVTSIGSEAFYGCSNLTSVDIPSGVTSINWGTFGDCSRLTNVTIPSSVIEISECAFYNTSLDAATISTIEAINPAAFTCS